MKPNIITCATTTRYWGRQFDYTYMQLNKDTKTVQPTWHLKKFLPTYATHLCNKISKTVQLKKDGVPI